MPTRSPRAALLGEQVPRVRHAPSVRANDWEDVADLAKAYGLVLDEWQENVFEAAMGVRSDGRWAASTVGVNVARQNGKGAIIEARELAGLLIFGEKVIVHSAHEQATARVGFQRILSYFENYDDLRKKVQSVMSAIHREHIRLKNGAELHFPARSKGRIRGYSIDCLILDEAQELGDPVWEAIKPTISARPNAQTWLLGTTPTPLNDSAVFTRTRQRGHEAKDKRLAWCEWSTVAGASLDDREAWEQANPALGTRITEAAIEDERAELSEQGFARERLSIWPADEARRVIPAEVWNPRLADDPPAQNVPPTALAVDMSHDRVISIAGCWRTEEAVHVEAVAIDRPTDTLAAVEWLVERAGRKIPVVVDTYSPANSMIPALKERRVKIVTANSGADMAKACGGFYDDVVAGRLTHAGQVQVDDALAGATKRRIGDAGGWGWDRRDPEVDISPLVAVTLARFGATVSKTPKTNRAVFA